MDAMDLEVLFDIIRFVVDMGCVAAFALSGVVAVRYCRAELDVLGVIVVAVVTAVGGGTVRDVLLGVPVFWLTDIKFIYCPVIAGLAGFFIIRRRRHHYLEIAVNLLDAFGLAYFSVLGTQKALNLGMGPEAAVLMGVITGVVGGMMRDTYTGQVPFVMRKNGSLYATACIAGNVVVVLWPGTVGLWAGGLIVLALRMSAIIWRIRLPSAGW
ncbi:MAG: TRIC cation channel family protein [Desulfovibrionaceae bacterium]|nr:TRIC cation channel family protein [Desulfovibrionaceae bacterium]